MERPTARVFKWGGGLAVLPPAALVEALGLKEGDEVEVEVAGDRAREAALERLRALRLELPPDHRFSRDEANERGGG